MHCPSTVPTLNLSICCKPGQVKPTYIEWGNGVVAMQVSWVNLFELSSAYIECGNCAVAMQVSQVNLFELGSTYLHCRSAIPTFSVSWLNLSEFTVHVYAAGVPCWQPPGQAPLWSPMFGQHILLTAALLKLKVFHPISLASLARELLSMQGTLVNNNQTFSETKLL